MSIEVERRGEEEGRKDGGVRIWKKMREGEGGEGKGKKKGRKGVSEGGRRGESATRRDKF